MSANQKVEAVLENAIVITKRRVKLYENISERIDNPEAKKMFSQLIEKMEKHIELIDKIRQMLDNYKLIDKHPAAFDLFLSGVSARVVSETERAERLLLSQDIWRTIGLTTTLEMNSMLFFEEISTQFESEEPKTIFKTIIDEERSHWAMLTHLKNNAEI